MNRQNNPPAVKVYVLSHLPQRLESLPTWDWLQPVLLTDLDGPWQDPRLGECRAFLANLDPGKAEYIGFLNARLPEKYTQFGETWDHVHHAVTRHLTPGTVWAAWGAPADWWEFSTIYHPQMTPLLRELVSRWGHARHQRVSLWAHDFICHRDVWHDWCRFFTRCLTIFTAATASICRWPTNPARWTPTARTPIFTSALPPCILRCGATCAFASFTASPGGKVG